MAFLPVDQDQTEKIRDALTVKLFANNSSTTIWTKVGSHNMAEPVLRTLGAMAFMNAYTLTGTTYNLTETAQSSTTTYKCYPLYSISAENVQKIFPKTDISSWQVGYIVASVGAGIAIHTGVKQPSASTNIWRDAFNWQLIKHSSSTYYLYNSLLSSSSSTSVTLPYNIYCAPTLLMGSTFLPNLD